MRNNSNLVTEQVNEFIKCKNSFEYFVRNYILIELPGGDKLMNPYQKQIELVKFIEENKYVLVLKSRQIGISTITQAYCCWLCTFFKNVAIGIISKDGPEATTFARKIVSMLDKLPKWFSIKYKKKSEQSFILKSGCKCFATPVNKYPEKTLRGKDITLLVIDEAAFAENLDKAWTSLVPSLSTNQMTAKRNNIPYGTIILSTPNKTVGVGKWFYDKYKSAVSNENIIKYFEIHWKQIPELAGDPDWYKIQCELLDHNISKISQELELKFVSTEGTFLPDNICRLIQENTKNIKPIKIINLFGGEIWVFKEAQPGKFYLIGVDSATAYGGDKSTIVVFEYESLEQVWEYQTKCKVIDFCKSVQFACACYKNGVLIVENNSVGNQVVETLERSDYFSMLYKETKGQKITPGLNLNAKTRPLVIDSLYTYITQFPELVKSKRLALELIGLTEKNNKVEADKGLRDDLALASAFCFYVRRYDPPLSIELRTDIEKYTQDFTTALQLNDIVKNTDNSSILKHIKRKIEEDTRSGQSVFFDTYKMFIEGV